MPPDLPAPLPPRPLGRRGVLLVRPSPAARSGAASRGIAVADRWALRLAGDRSERVLALSCLGALIEIGLVMLTRRFWLTDWYPGPGISLGFPQMMSGAAGADAAWYAFVTGAPFLAFVPALVIGRRLSGPLACSVVFGYAALFGLTLVPLYPVAASDLFHNVADARTLWVYHQNPLLVAPAAHPFFIGISWAEQPSPYGPLWQLLAIPPIAVAGGGAVASVIAFKLLSLGAYLACAVLVYRIVRRTFPGRELLATLAFAWNPFLTFHGVGNAHNDLVMLCFALLALELALTRRWLFTLPVLALSACIKYATVLLLPLVLLYAWDTSNREERRRLLLACLLALVVTIEVFAPFWAGLDTFKTFMGENNKTISSLPQLMSLILRHLDVAGNDAAADRAVRRAGIAAFVLLYGVLLLALHRRPTFVRLVGCAGLAFATYLAVAKWWFRPWYILWFTPLFTLIPTRYWLGLAVATSFGATFFDIAEYYRPYWPWLSSSELRTYAAPVVTVFLPLVLGVLAGGARCLARLLKFHRGWWQQAGRAPP